MTAFLQGKHDGVVAALKKQAMPIAELEPARLRAGVSIVSTLSGSVFRDRRDESEGSRRYWRLLGDGQAAASVRPKMQHEAVGSIGGEQTRNCHQSRPMIGCSHPSPPYFFTRLDVCATAFPKLELPELPAPVYGTKVPQPFPTLRSISEHCTPRDRIGEACQGKQ